MTQNGQNFFTVRLTVFKLNMSIKFRFKQFGSRFSRFKRKAARYGRRQTVKTLHKKRNGTVRERYEIRTPYCIDHKLI